MTRHARAAEASVEADEAAGDRGDAPCVAVRWPDRARAVGATPFDAARGAALFAALWDADLHGVELDAAELARLAGHLAFVTVPARRELIAQDESGDFMLIVLEGRIAVDRVQPWGARARLAEASAGEMLGEMSLLDAGARFSACSSLGDCVLAVLDAEGLDALMRSEPRLALALMTSLARRLSLRLRQVSARLSALLSGA
jgi:CRP/FNR family cyclic AMP-dependent transcriptional regulator